MSEFGNLLRSFRHQCNDSENSGRRLSQERLGELLGRELNTRAGYSGAAISDWERGMSKIHADQRPVLISLLMILHRLGGLKTYIEADELLRAGNYRALEPDEKQKIFPDALIGASLENSTNQPDSRQQNSKFPFEKEISEFNDELQRLFNEAEEGPSPSWPRVIATLLSRSSNHLSISDIALYFIWLWVWLITWILIAPSLRLPFVSHENAEMALEFYVGGTLVVPLLIGVLTNTKQNKFWQDHNLASKRIIRLYTYQGAGVGFHIAYFGVFAVNLLGYYMRIHFALWFEVIEIGLILLWGYLAARVVPYNLWRAYRRLDLADGWIFFVFLVLGPFWAFFFYEFYESLLSSTAGGLTILLSITLLIIITAWRQSRNTKPR